MTVHGIPRASGAGHREWALLEQPPDGLEELELLRGRRQPVSHGGGDEEDCAAVSKGAIARKLRVFWEMAFQISGFWILKRISREVQISDSPVSAASMPPIERAGAFSNFEMEFGLLKT